MRSSWRCGSSPTAWAICCRRCREEKFATEREVVLNERRQNYENRPYGLTSVALAEALYRARPSVSWVTIGAPADLVASSVDDARAFFQRFYHPGNASLAIAGDVVADEVFALVERYFGDLPRRPRGACSRRSRRRWPARRGWCSRIGSSCRA